MAISAASVPLGRPALLPLLLGVLTVSLGCLPLSRPAAAVTTLDEITARRPPNAQAIAVPSYFDAVSQWQQLADGAPTVGLAIINPHNGPGKRAEPEYATFTRRSQQRGVAVVGYVHTQWGQRPTADGRADIDAYYAWYGVDGIFFDEVSTDCAVQPYYADLNAYVKGREARTLTVLNPGLGPGECYMAAGDVLVTFEQRFERYTQQFT